MTSNNTTPLQDSTHLLIRHTSLTARYPRISSSRFSGRVLIVVLVRNTSAIALWLPYLPIPVRKWRSRFRRKHNMQIMLKATEFTGRKIKFTCKEKPWKHQIKFLLIQHFPALQRCFAISSYQCSEGSRSIFEPTTEFWWLWSDLHITQVFVNSSWCLPPHGIVYSRFWWCLLSRVIRGR